MKLLKFTYQEETETIHFFRLKIELTNFWGKKTIKEIDCFREKKLIQSSFLKDGKSVFWKYLELDNAINAILTKKDKSYINTKS